MARRYKIKRSNGRIYDPVRGKLIKLGLALGAAALLFLLGWLVYEPVFNAITQKRDEISSQSSVSESVSESASESVPEPAPEPTFFDGSVRAAYAPVSVLTDDAAWGQFLTDAKAAGLNAVMFDMKDADGGVTYDSQQESVTAVGTEIEAPVDLAARVASLREAGLSVIARVYAFQDPLASQKNADMAVRYMEADGVIWLDDAQEQGGRSWLNPYSETAQKYVLDVVYDAISAGCDCVMLDGVRFPAEYGTSSAYYGERAAQVDRRTVLEEFTQKAKDACEKRDVELLLGYDGASVFSGETEIYGGSPAVLPASGYSPTFLPSALVGAEGLPKTLTYTELPEDLGAVMKSMVEALSLATDAEQMPLVQAYDLTAANIRSMMTALEEAGMDDCILYDPNGTAYLKDLAAAASGESQPEESSSESSSESSAESSSEAQKESTPQPSSVPEIALPSSSQESSAKQAFTFSAIG